MKGVLDNQIKGRHRMKNTIAEIKKWFWILLTLFLFSSQLDNALAVTSGWKSLSFLFTHARSHNRDSVIPCNYAHWKKKEKIINLPVMHFNYVQEHECEMELGWWHLCILILTGGNYQITSLSCKLSFTELTETNMAC